VINETKLCMMNTGNRDTQAHAHAQMLLVRFSVPSAALGALHSDVGAVIVIPELSVVQLADCVLHVLSGTVEEVGVHRRRGEERIE
jgi:hypothetical protein